ncbi:MAG: DUF1858 domain-containing protein [Lachnospiraceae bacterium]|nr:DUF1858 domain-containing protein [Lachnospiraceae bacterium]
MAKQVTKDMLIYEILEIDPGNAAILMASGMHCVGCPSSAMESLEDACMVHGMDVDDVIYSINEYLKKKEATAQTAQ